VNWVGGDRITLKTAHREITFQGGRMDGTDLRLCPVTAFSGRGIELLSSVPLMFENFNLRFLI
jgi:hypothetical protein